MLCSFAFNLNTCPLAHLNTSLDLQTIFKLNQLPAHHPTLKRLKRLLSGREISPAVWACQKNRWLALFKPLNLGIVYLNLPEIEAAKSREINQAVFAALSAASMLADAAKEQSELESLKLAARKGSFRFICVMPTIQCHLKCAYCHQSVRSYPSSSMTLRQIDQSLRKCAELCGNDHEFIDILFYGGEPMMAFHLTETIVKTVKHNRLFKLPVRFSFTTSGYKMTTSAADFLARHNVFVIVSLDGSPQTNDKVRKQKDDSSFDTAKRAFDILRNRKCRLGLSFTIGKHNHQVIEDELHYLLKTMHPDDIGLNAFLHPIGDKKNPYQINAQEAFNSFLQGVEIVKSYGIYAEQPMRRLRPFVFRKPLLKDCSAPGERLVLVPGGMIGFCDSFYFEGKYYYPINDFPDHSHPDYQMWNNLSSVEMPLCSLCPAMTVCGGACRYDAYKASGTLHSADPMRCIFELDFLHWMIWELFSLSGNGNKLPYFLPTPAERRLLLGKMDLHADKQPFTAGTYAGVPNCE